MFSKINYFVFTTCDLTFFCFHLMWFPIISKRYATHHYKFSQLLNPSVSTIENNFFCFIHDFLKCFSNIVHDFWTDLCIIWLLILVFFYYMFHQQFIITSNKLMKKIRHGCEAALYYVLQPVECLWGGEQVHLVKLTVWLYIWNQKQNRKAHIAFGYSQAYLVPGFLSSSGKLEPCWNTPTTAFGPAP